MDRFIIKSTKENGAFLGNQAVHDVIENIVNTNDIVCLYGESGVGKTHLIEFVMKGRNWVDLNHELIKTPDFMERLKNSDCHVVLDDLESDVHLVKDLFETIRSGRKLSKGATIVVVRNLSKVDFCNGVYFDPLDNPTMVTIGRKKFPKEPLKRLEQLARESNGNVRTFLYSIAYSGKRDLFRTPRDFVCDLLCESNVNPRDYIGKPIQEHGYTWDIVHENYPDAPGVDLTYVSECMSQADILDTEIYKGNWNLVPLFSTVSTVIPALHINHSLNRESIRSGSAWTKYGNFKMRDMKYRSMSHRCAHKVDVDSLMLVKTYCQTDQAKALDVCREYRLGSADMDVINHLALVNKMKSKELQMIKKLLKNASS